ncbi:esterase/lipase family protein [Micromonospora sp. NPDC005806]|uniref:esterase/lipase family protein n=1 Tax=Micromonospora sp. NPDC005806 TaxID=3364234 RepID=UPI003673FD9E
MGRLDTRLVGLVVLAALPPAVEGAILAGVGFRAAEGLAPQVTAVWPYDTYHDLRWLLVYHDSWPTFVLGLAGVVTFRALLTTGLVALAWPRQVPRPRVRWLAGRNLVLTSVLSVVVSPWAALSLAASVVALSWLLLASLLPLFLLAPFLQRAAVERAWWRGLPSIELVGWSLLNFVVLTVGGAMVWSVPTWWTAPVAALAGVVNGLLWQRTVAAALLPRRPVRWARVPVAPLAVLLAFAAPLVVQPLFAALPGTSKKAPSFLLLERPLPSDVRHAVIFLGGHGSAYAGEATADPNIQWFSYRGLDAQGRPVPYEPRDTYRSISSSVALLAAQVDLLHRRTGRPLALIGQSEGALVARTYLADRPHPAVDTMAMFSPLINTGRSYYPPEDASSGWGIAAGWELRVLFGLADVLARSGSGPDEPFIRSLLDDAPFYRTELMCPVPGVRILAFLPTTTATEAPPGEYTGIPVFQMPAVHGGLLGQPVVEARLVNFLAGEPVSRPQRGYVLLQQVAAAWQAPPLPFSLNPVWRRERVSDPAFTGKVCGSR